MVVRHRARIVGTPALGGLLRERPGAFRILAAMHDQVSVTRHTSASGNRLNRHGQSWPEAKIAGSREALWDGAPVS